MLAVTLEGFWLGVVATVLLEVVIIVGVAVYFATKPDDKLAREKR